MDRFALRFLIILSFILGPFFISPVRGEAFGNSSLIFPKIGASFFDNGILFNSKPWGLNHQWTFGTAFMRALNYRWWWVADSHMGFGHLSEKNQVYVGTFSGGTGLRFNIFQGDFRPHTGMMLQYLHFLGGGVKHMPLHVGWPIFIGLRPYFGLEWLFYSEMSLALEGSYGLYVNINEPLRQALHANVLFSFYF